MQNILVTVSIFDCIAKWRDSWTGTDRVPSYWCLGVATKNWEEGGSFWDISGYRSLGNLYDLNVYLGESSTPSLERIRQPQTHSSVLNSFPTNFLLVSYLWRTLSNMLPVILFPALNLPLMCLNVLLLWFPIKTLLGNILFEKYDKNKETITSQVVYFKREPLNLLFLPLEIISSGIR